MLARAAPPTSTATCLPLNRLVVDAAASIYRQIYSCCPLARRPGAGGRVLAVRISAFDPLRASGDVVRSVVTKAACQIFCVPR